MTAPDPNAALRPPAPPPPPPCPAPPPPAAPLQPGDVVRFRSLKGITGLGQVVEVIPPLGSTAALVCVRTWWPIRTREFALPLTAVTKLEDLTAHVLAALPPEVTP